MAQTDIYDYQVATPKIVGNTSTLAFGVSAITLTGNYTLLSTDYANTILSFSGSPAGPCTITSPLTGGTVFIVVNGSSQSVTIQGSTGTGVTIATSKTAIVRTDGTNYYRVTADT